MLQHDDSYGYQIIQDAPEVLTLSESTLYPILRRLHKQGLIRECQREHSGRTRKYYAITERGREHLGSFREERAEIEQVLAFIEERCENE